VPKVPSLSQVLVLVGIVATLMSAAAPAEAQRRRSANNEQQQKARTAYARGQELFQAEQFEEAKVSFNEAFEAVPNPVVLLSLAECEVKLNQLPEAVTTLERYLALREDAPDRAQIEAKIATIKETPATLAISSDTPGAGIKIDGADTGQVTPAEVQVAPGAHVVQVAFGTEEGSTQSMTARYGQRHELSVELGARTLVDPFGDSGIAGPSQQPAASAEEVEVSTGGAGAAAWVLVSVGAAGIVAGSVLGFMTLSAKNDFDQAPTADTADKGERLALFTDVAFGVGAVCLITGLVLAVTADDADASGSEAGDQSARLRVTPVLGPTTAALSAQLQF